MQANGHLNPGTPPSAAGATKLFTVCCASFPHRPLAAHATTSDNLYWVVMCRGPRAAGMALLMGACLMTQGCVGVFALRTQRHSADAPIVCEKPALYLASSPTDGTTNPTGKWLREHWGEPASVRVVSTEPQAELWTYRFGHPWRGIIPCVIIPIPLVLPVEQEKVVFMVKEGRVVSADISTLRWSGGAAGYLMGPEPRFGASGGW